MKISHHYDVIGTISLEINQQVQKIFIMHDIIYMPFHCSELGLNLVEFSVCCKEQFGVKANTLLTALGNQTISANCTCTGVVFSQWTELII